MVATYTIEPAFRRYGYVSSIPKLSRTRQYDSFVVRLWHSEGSNAMLRAEVQHMQAGVSMEAVQVPLDWIVPQILGCLSTGDQIDAKQGCTEPSSRSHARMQKQSGTRQYDSFVVRLWHSEGSNAMLRAEVQHVQAGLSTEAVQVPLDWIVPQILGCLQTSIWQC